MHIRKAEEKDIPSILVLGRRMHAESPRFSSFAFNPDKCADLCRNLITSPMGRVFVAEKEKEILGVFAGFVAEHFFSDELTASDVAVYVLPEYRNGMAFIRMLQAFEDSVTPDNGSIEVTLGISTEINPEKTRRLYACMGYSNVGFTMRRTLNHV